MQPIVDSIRELFVGVEALGSQIDLHLGEEMVNAWHQVRIVRRVVENLPVEKLDQSIFVSRSVGPRIVQENDAFSDHPTPFVFLGLVGRMHVHPLFRLLFGLCIH